MPASSSRPSTQAPQTFSPTNTFAPTQSCSVRVVIDFETAGNRTALSEGAYVGKDWHDRYGLTISVTATTGGFTPDNMGRIFDSTNPGKSELDGDPDLGSPNR